MQHKGLVQMHGARALASQDDLGRQPGPCAGRCHLAEVVLAHQRGQAHIRDLGRAVARDEDVAGLQVEMHDPARHHGLSIQSSDGLVLAGSCAQLTSKGSAKPPSADGTFQDFPFSLATLLRHTTSTIHSLKHAMTEQQGLT